MEPTDIIQDKLDELRSQIQSGKREANSYIETGHAMHEKADALEAQAKKFEDFLIQIELDNAERAARANQAEVRPEAKA